MAIISTVCLCNHLGVQLEQTTVDSALTIVGLFLEELVTKLPNFSSRM